MGSIKKRTTRRGADRWDVRVRSGGKVITRTFTTAADAKTWERKVELGATSAATEGRRTLADYAEAWMDTRPLAPKSVELYRDLLDRWLLPDLGGIQLRRLTPERVRVWWAAQPDGSSYPPKAYRLLRAILATAVDDEVLATNPCRIKGAGVERSSERPSPEPHEIDALVAAAPARARALIALAGWGGLRRGEILGLQRRHVDPLHGTVRVEQAAQWLKGQGRTIRRPKTDAGRRTVHLDRDTMALLERHLAAYVPADPDAWLAVGDRGRPLDPFRLTTWWDVARQSTGLTHLRFHDLRHGAGTLAARTGATTREIQARIGHASDAAARRYQHAAQSRDAAIADALRDLPRDGRAMRHLRAAGDDADS